MSANTTLRVTELEPENIKENLKTSLSANTVFQDYNFDGSALNLHLDILKHDTYYAAYYLNMLFNEAFLDSAIRRTSAVSRAKELGYTPRSAKCAQAKLSVTVIPNNAPAFITVPVGTRFRGSKDGYKYNFQTMATYTISPVSGVYTTEMVVYEGDRVNQTYTVQDSDSNIIIRLNNQNIDTDTLTVRIKESSSSSVYADWKQAINILEAKADAEIYYLVENMDGYYELQFGQNVLGKRPSLGNIIEISYLATNGPNANSIRVFSSLDSIGGYGNFSFRTTQKAVGGQYRESIESIKFNAPRYYDMQNRAVTANDYKQHILSKFDDIQAISVWGGEKNDPPMYGKVFISLKPNDGFAMSELRKTNIYNSLTNINVHTIEPVFVDPTIIYIVPKIIARYNSQITNLKAEDIRAIIANAVKAYELANLNTFDKTFRLSRLSTIIDNSHKSIVSNQTTFVVEKKFYPILNDKFTYLFPFHTKVLSMSSSGFTFPTSTNVCYFEDDKNGKIVAYYLQGKTKIYLKGTYGTIDYSTGKIVLTNFNPSSVVGTTDGMHIDVVSESSDFIPIKNQIVLISTPTLVLYDDSTDNLLSSQQFTTYGSLLVFKEVPILRTVTV